MTGLHTDAVPLAVHTYVGPYGSSCAALCCNESEFYAMLGWSEGKHEECLDHQREAVLLALMPDVDLPIEVILMDLLQFVGSF